jgi:malate synthase
MEDLATAEISRAQVWSWVRDGRFDKTRVRDEIDRVDAGAEAKDVFAQVALAGQLPDFTSPVVYHRLP